MKIPDLRLGDGVVGPPPPHLWEIRDAATACGTDPDAIVQFAITHELRYWMYETPVTVGPQYGVYTFVDRPAFVRAWMRQVNQ